MDVGSEQDEEQEDEGQDRSEEEQAHEASSEGSAQVVCVVQCRDSILATCLWFLKQILMVLGSSLPGVPQIIPKETSSGSSQVPSAHF